MSDTEPRWGTAAAHVRAERWRAHEKHSARGTSAEQIPHDHPLWLPILVEEVGEVARALCDREPLEHLYLELIQVAAMAEAWADALRAVLGDDEDLDEDDES